MFSQLFGRYLVKRELLNEEDYKAIIAEQMTVRVKLGTIAVTRGILSEEQVEEINVLQKSEDKRFGDVAVAHGYLTDEQVVSLLKEQGNPYLQFVQLLTDLTDLSNSDIERELAAFQKENGLSNHEMEALKQDDIDGILPVFVVSSKSYVQDITGLVTRNITRFVSRDFYIEKAKRVSEYNYANFACQELAGNDSVFIGLGEATDNGALARVASGFAKKEIKEISEDAFDAVGEFINVTSGIFASALSTRKVEIDMEPPLGFKNQTAKGDFYVIPVYLEQYRLDIIISVNADFVAGEKPEKTGSVVKTVTDAEAGTGNANILIVDDSRMSREMLRNILEKAGYNVVGEAANGEEGVEAYKKLKPDVVTMDITMPQKDGLQALKEILAFDADARIVMITAAGQQDKLIQALKEGAKRFINKPFNEVEITVNIKDVLK